MAEVDSTKVRHYSRIILDGQRFGRLLVIKEIRIEPQNERRFLCLCDCGNKHEAGYGNLRAGNVRSCGCFGRTHSITHGCTANRKRTRAYSSWAAMRQRCTDPNFWAFDHYGGRGITICKRWRHSFENFLADMGEPAKGMTLDRIDNDGGYSPENCRWATRKEQANNSRKNVMVTFRGKTQSLSRWSEEVGIRPERISRRLKNGWSVEQALTIPACAGQKIMSRKKAKDTCNEDHLLNICPE